MNILNQLANLNISHDQFIPCMFNDLQLGTIVMSTTYTYSQKYINEMYEPYNMTKIGILTNKDVDDPGNSTIIQIKKSDNDGENTVCCTATNLYADPRSSGCVMVYYHKDAVTYAI